MKSLVWEVAFFSGFFESLAFAWFFLFAERWLELLRAEPLFGRSQSIRD